MWLKTKKTMWEKMTFKQLLGLGEAQLTDEDIMQRICTATASGQEFLVFGTSDIGKVHVHFPLLDFGRYIDVWDHGRGQ